MSWTILLASGLNVVSSHPVAERRRIRFLAVPDIVVNCHPTRIFPSPCGVMEKIVLLKFGVKDPISHPVDENLSIRFLVVPDDVVNCHQTKIESSGRTAIVRTILLRFGVKVVSIEPSLLRRARKFLFIAFTPVKAPPIRIFPSDWRAVA
jgi:hypothetical protein